MTTHMIDHLIAQRNEAVGQVGVLRDLLMEALSIIKTIDADSDYECNLLATFRHQAEAAIEGTRP